MLYYNQKEKRKGDKKMTVNELIKELQKIADEGHGDATVINRIITDDGGEEVGWCEYRNGEVNLYE